jgi:hypothetical protein
MAIAILNYDESDRRSARAGADNMEIGDVVQVIDDPDTAGARKAIPAGNTGTTLVRTAVGILWKVRMDGRRVVTTTSLSTKQLRDLGDARTYVDSGDQIVVVRSGAIIEFDEDSCHSSLYTTNLPNVDVGDLIVIKDSKIAKSGTSSANTTPNPFAYVYAVSGAKIFVELV